MKTNIDYLMRIKEYCEEIFTFHERFGNSLENYEEDVAYRNAVNMSIVQIGELCGKLTEDFKNEMNGVNWREIKDYRNLVAHQYDRLDNKQSYEISTDDIRELYLYVNSILDVLEKS